MLKRILYALAVALLLLACYFGYDWYISEPDNKESLPALLSFVSSLITLLIAWRSDQASTSYNTVKVKNTSGNSVVDIDPTEQTNYTVSKINNSKIYIGKGKDSLKGNTNENTPS